MIYKFRSHVAATLKVSQIISLTLIISACQNFSFTGASQNRLNPELLESLQPVVMSIRAYDNKPVSLEQVIESYTSLLPLVNDPATQIKVLHRLADLKLEKGEYLMAEQAIDELDIAVSAYQGLLTNYPERPDNDHVLYQLSKTYDLKGLRELHLASLDTLVNNYPDSRYYSEVQFRRGEILFTDGFYAEAQKAFDAVISTGEDSYLSNALYMKGWSLFKQNLYAPALLSYTKVLDLVLSENQSNQELSQKDVQKKYQTLVEDLLRVMGLSFSYLGGEKSIATLFDQVGPRFYEILIYERYSDLLLKKEQYTNVIALYKHFIARHPLSLWSPRYQINVIETLGIAGFKRDIYAEKVVFVQTYGKGSPYWEHYAKTNETELKESDLLLFPKAKLLVLLPELADYHFVLAQKALKQNANNTMNIEFKNAAHYNRAFVETFPQHPQTASRFFLLAESELHLRRWESAIEAFEQAAYQFETYENASEAGYASILAYTNYVNAVTKQQDTVNNSDASKQLNELKQKQQQSRLRFVAQHMTDDRALAVLFISNSFTFEQKRYEESVQLAQRIIDWPELFEGAPAVDDATLLEAMVIKAHSLYALKKFTLAETAYQSVLLSMPIKDPRHLALVENLAACVFNQAEQFLADGKKQRAIDEFLRVGVVAPKSTLRASAEYDAANYLLELKQWPKLIEVLVAFRANYPQHSLINTLPAKLALAYRETKQWDPAAKELHTMYALATDPKEKQDTLYIVAELYDKAENHQQAILSYRKYANTYASPVETYMEAANRLAELYLLTDKPLKRRFWLAKQMKAVDTAGDSADDRMRYLAAAASSVLANDGFVQYKRVKLTLPLNEAMTKKTKALEKAMKAFQKTASYGVSQYSTEAGYRMADIYAQLSKDLMASDRPDGLNELELEQYEILLEEQTFPFEDSAIDIHEQNASRSWNGIYDKWVKNSFKSLRKLLPGRYAKDELLMGVTHDLN